MLGSRFRTGGERGRRSVSDWSGMEGGWGRTGSGDVEGLVVVQWSGGVGDGGGVVDGLGEVVGFGLDDQGGDGVLGLGEGVECVVDLGDVAVDVADGLVDGGIVTLDDRWRGQGEEWEEDKSGEHLDCFDGGLFWMKWCLS